MNDSSKTSEKSENVVWHEGALSRADRERAKGHRAAVLWLTGLSGSGKSTLANAVEERLAARGCTTYLLDGDNIRHGLSRDLGFSPEDRGENNRRIAEVAKLFVDAGVLVLSAFVSPHRHDRQVVRDIVGADFHEIYVRADLATCEARDPKGLYKKARKGEITNFTGVDAPYEEPEHPDLLVDTSQDDLDACLEQVMAYIESRGLLAPPGA